MTRGLPTTCRACGSRATIRLGALPIGSEFAGLALDPPLAGGELVRCTSCCLLFRHPILNMADYNALYGRASATFWGRGDDLRPDQKLVKTLIERERPAAARVLDVGCYSGDLLASLSGRYEKFGVEQCRAAVERARGRGITILGEDLYAMDLQGQRFDVIVAMDVVEHTVDPEAFVRRLLGCLADNGILVLTTADADNAIWRLSGSAFWYCANPEHISFISTRWLRAAENRGTFRIHSLERFRYAERKFVNRIAKWLVIAVRRALHAPIRSSWTAHISRDHVLVVLGRPAGS